MPHEAPIPVTPHAFDEPIARGGIRRPIPVKPGHVRLHVQLDPATPVVKGRVWHTVEILGDDICAVPLDAEDMVVHAVEIIDADGAALSVEHHPFDGGIMVDLGQPRSHGDQITLALRFTAWPSAGLYFITPDRDRPNRRPQIWTQGAMEDHHRWFPCFDGPEHMVTSEVIADVPEGYRAVSNGVPVEEAATDLDPLGEDLCRFHWRHDSPHAQYLLTLVVDDSVEVVAEAGPVSLHHYVPKGREADAEMIFARVGEMLDFFKASTGRAYPYPRYGHVFLQGFMWGGMENTTLTSLTDQVLVEGRHAAEEDVARLVAHELAHQWFGDLIAPRGWPEIWLNESFATYFEQLCMQALEGDDDFARRMQGERDSYLSEARDRYTRPVVSRRYADPYVLFDRHAYEKGCLVLHTLRDQLGDGAFFRGVRTYVERMAGRAAETADLRRAFEESTGLDLHPFFEQWVYGDAHPKVKVESAWRQGTLHVQISREDEGDHRLDMTVAAWAGGELHRWRVAVGPEGGALSCALATPPSWVALDPDQRCLVEIDESEISDNDLLARLLGGGFADPEASPGGEGAGPAPLRARTIRALASRGRPMITEALSRALAHDPSAFVRAEAAAALGEHRSAQARAALARALDVDESSAPCREPEWRVRAAAAKALGQGGEAAEVDLLGRVARAEISHRVRCGALAGLGEIKTEAARAVIRRELDTPSPRSCVSAAAIQALAAHEQGEAFDELSLRLQRGHHRSVRMAAAGALARLGKAGNDDLRRRAQEALERALFDDVFAIRLSAIRGLARLGAKEAAPALKRAHGAEGSALIRRYIREALGTLSA